MLFNYEFEFFWISNNLKLKGSYICGECHNTAQNDNIYVGYSPRGPESVETTFILYYITHKASITCINVHGLPTQTTQPVMFTDHSTSLKHKQRDLWSLILARFDIITNTAREATKLLQNLLNNAFSNLLHETNSTFLPPSQPSLTEKQMKHRSDSLLFRVRSENKWELERKMHA
jgi:hypothetical protein